MKENVEQEIEKLINLINYHNWRYYVLQDPEISDEEFDALYNKLKQLEKNTGIIKPYSPTQRISSLLSEFKKEEHISPVLSLDAVYNKEELKEFLKSIFKNLNYNAVEFLCELKFDGINLSVIYKKENGKFVFLKALTRGDGFQGEDVTLNAKTIKTIPLVIYPELPNQVEFIQVNGEVLLYKEDLEIINKQREKENLPKFSNTRNAASGSLRQQDPSITASRNLKFFAYHFKFFDTNKKELIIEKKLSKLFEIFSKYFVVSPKYEIVDIFSIEDIFKLENYYQRIQNEKENFPFEIDGVVFKIDNIEFQKILGNTLKNYKWAVAYKFSSDIFITKLIDVEYQVGRTGVITPVAVLEPINIDGVKVKNASLHNFDYIKSKDIKIGDYVEVRRAGKVIPEVVKVIEELRENVKEIEKPLICPSCGSKLEEDGSFLICKNPNCIEKIIAKIVHWFSKEALNIDVSEGIISKLVKSGLVKDVADMYKLTPAELAIVGNLGKKSASKLYHLIQSTKNSTFDKVLYALGIPSVGLATSKLLAQKFKNIDELMNANFNELSEIPRIGPEIAKNIKEFFENPENKKLIEKLKKIMNNL
ncbi:MAG: NAD-dependent DNA ligase LigA [bacterium]